MQKTKVISVTPTNLKHKEKKVFKVVRQYTKDNWSHKVATVEDLCTMYVKNDIVNGSQICYKKIYV